MFKFQSSIVLSVKTVRNISINQLVGTRPHSINAQNPIISQSELASTFRILANGQSVHRLIHQLVSPCIVRSIRWSDCTSVGPSVGQPMHRLVHLLVCTCLGRSIRQSAHTLVGPSVGQPIHRWVHPSVSPYICQSIRWSASTLVSPSIIRPVHRSVHVSVSTKFKRCCL